MNFINTALTHFAAGGWISPAIAVLALYAYYLGFLVLFRLLRYNSICKKLKDFEFAFLDFAKRDSIKEISFEDAKKGFNLLRSDILHRVNSRLKLMAVFGTVLPLLGLLGTVSGMSIILGAIKDVDYIALGISKVLVTTQIGLSASMPVWVIILICRYFNQKFLVKFNACEVLILRSKTV